MKLKHANTKLEVIFNTLCMAAADARVLLEICEKDNNIEGIRASQKEYNRIERAKQYFLELFLLKGKNESCEGGCEGCPGCSCDNEEEKE